MASTKVEQKPFDLVRNARTLQNSHRTTILVMSPMSRFEEILLTSIYVEEREEEEAPQSSSIKFYHKL
jgi:hypothetical protein